MAEFLEMRGIVKTFPGVLALDHVNLSVRKGEVHALLGENGAGMGPPFFRMENIHGQPGL